MRMLLGAVFLTGACAAVPPPPEPNQEVPVHGETGQVCDASKAAKLIGRQATAELGAEAIRLSGAGRMRWLRPGDMVTMDFREDRLNIELDPNNRVKAVRCG